MKWHYLLKSELFDRGCVTENLNLPFQTSKHFKTNCQSKSQLAASQRFKMSSKLYWLEKSNVEAVSASIEAILNKITNQKFDYVSQILYFGDIDGKIQLLRNLQFFSWKFFGYFREIKSNIAIWRKKSNFWNLTIFLVKILWLLIEIKANCDLTEKIQLLGLKTLSLVKIHLLRSQSCEIDFRSSIER